MTPSSRFGTRVTWAMLDLGALVRTARKPNHAACPLRPICRSTAQAQPSHLNSVNRVLRRVLRYPDRAIVAARQFGSSG
jgi:adenine-specific DNA glycosylase